MKSGLILLDIFSYSCMNCLRSLEFIKKIDNKYKKFGLKTILVHPPEWEFESDDKNIWPALKKYNITFPIIIDKNKKIIKSLRVDFWPTQVLVKDGKVLYKNVGEGSYKKLENNIIKILKIKSKKLFAEEPKYIKYPTVYCGKRKNGKIRKFDKILKFGIIRVQGGYYQKGEFLQLFKDSPLAILTKGKMINFVAESLNNKPVKVDVELNGEKTKTLHVDKPRLYNLVKLNRNNQNRLTIIPKSCIAVYSFSFQ